jgi:hypothetical protein
MPAAAGCAWQDCVSTAACIRRSIRTAHKDDQCITLRYQCMQCGCVQCGCVQRGCMQCGCMQCGCMQCGCMQYGCVQSLSCRFFVLSNYHPSSFLTAIFHHPSFPPFPSHPACPLKIQRIFRCRERCSLPWTTPASVGDAASNRWRRTGYAAVNARS